MKKDYENDRYTHSFDVCNGASIVILPADKWKTTVIMDKRNTFQRPPHSSTSVNPTNGYRKILSKWNQQAAWSPTPSEETLIRWPTTATTKGRGYDTFLWIIEDSQTSSSSSKPLLHCVAYLLLECQNESHSNSSSLLRNLQHPWNRLLNFFEKST